MCPQSSVKINQISLDESGDHVGICSEDGKVRSLCSSAPFTDPWAYTKKKIHNQCFSSFIIHLKLLIGAQLYAKDVELSSEFLHDSRSINLKFQYHHIYA